MNLQTDLWMAGECLWPKEKKALHLVEKETVPFVLSLL